MWEKRKVYRTFVFSILHPWFSLAFNLYILSCNTCHALLFSLTAGLNYWRDHIMPHSNLSFDFFLLSELLDGCRALLAVAMVTSPFVFDQLLKSIWLVV